MTCRNRLAILMPVRNAGPLLGRSLGSLGMAEIGPGEAEVLVLDNASDDGSTEELPARLDNGVAVHLVRNGRDLGRVGNWQKAVEVARDGGFGYAAFLFAGDTWAPGDGARRLLGLMRRSGACLGLAPYQMVREDGSLLCHSPRISIGGEEAVAGSEDLFDRMLRRGHLPLTPLQANIYRLEPERRLEFDPEEPLTTDMYATIDFLAAAPGTVAVTRTPFCRWLARPERVFCRSGLVAFLRDHFRQLEHAARRTGRRLDYSRARSVFLISYARAALQFGSAGGVVPLLGEVFREAGRHPGWWNPADIVLLAARKWLHGRSVLHLGVATWASTGGE